jgi:hypothetical protein
VFQNADNRRRNAVAALHSTAGGRTNPPRPDDTFSGGVFSRERGYAECICPGSDQRHSHDRGIMIEAAWAEGYPSPRSAAGRDAVDAALNERDGSFCHRVGEIRKQMRYPDRYRS